MMHYATIIAVTLLLALANADNTQSTHSIDGTQRRTRGRIVGGNAALPGEFPSFARNAGSPSCGATLIHPDVLLSSAFCEKQFLNGVFIGGVSLTGSDAEYRSVRYTYTHPYFDGVRFKNDILLIKLNNSSSRPLHVLNYKWTNPATGDNGTVVGYGQTSETSTIVYSPILLKVTIPVVPYSQCAAFYTSKPSQELSEICTNDVTAKKGICYGDGGGPLIAKDGTLLGVASYTTGCARGDSFPVFTRITGYYQYIEDTICLMSDVPPLDCAPRPTIKLRCGSSLRCPGTNWISRVNSGKCENACVSQSVVASRLKSGWKCGQTCF
jgi:trypsin